MVISKSQLDINDSSQITDNGNIMTVFIENFEYFCRNKMEVLHHNDKEHADNVNGYSDEREFTALGYNYFNNHV